MVGMLFGEVVRVFVDDRFALDPVAASTLGVHTHDHTFGDLSAAGWTKREAFVHEWIGRFEATVEDELPPYERIDRALILADLRGERALIPFMRWRRDPTLYAGLVTRAAYLPLVRAHASAEERLAVLAERLAEVPAVLDAARANLEPSLVPAEWVAIAERTAPAGAAFVRTELVRAVPDTALGRLVRPALQAAVTAAADALDRYGAWLRTDLAPAARGSFAIGRDAFEALLRDKELLDHDASSLRAFGEELLGATLADLRHQALGMGDDDWRDSLARLRQDHPAPDELVSTYRTEMERSREATRRAMLATIPYGEDLVVEEMPRFQRTTYPYAAYIASAPFERERRGRFWVTTPEPDDDDRTVRERLEGHPRAGIAIIACHEGYPGHHLQLTVAADNGQHARRAIRSNLMVEGWGLYVEELMTEVGYLDQPDTRLLRTKDLLWRAARVVVDVGLATGELTFDEAVSFMVEKAKLEPPNALAEVRRYTLTPTQPSSYALGRHAILELRERAKGKGMGMRYFHDALLQCGSLPPKLLATAAGLDE